MTSVSASPVKTAMPSRTPDPAPGRTAQPPAEDVKAMKDAMVAARQRQQQQPATKQPAGEKGATLVRMALPRGETKPVIPRDDADRFRMMRQEREDAMPTETGISIGGGPGQQAPVQLPQAPAPHVDPTAFAALIGQLWAREQAKGTREVSVRFGENAWPATGARLVRAADGTLDVALLVGGARGGEVETALPDLRERMAERGVAVGALAVERDV